ncbi:MAG: NTP transferase domain-containing protein [Butyrivibrio sp.]|nr:NTP transferase domain-containing protein [Butyrivibrio sp.]
MEYIIVQAGGKGTRLGYLTKNKPKALVPVDNLPMLFYLFRKYPQKRFVIIADYKKDVMREYLAAFADVKYQIVDASGTGTCSGVKQAIDLIPEHEAFMLVWSDLILPDKFELPEEYSGDLDAKNDYVGLSETFPCRWKYEGGQFAEERSTEYGVAGFFLFTEKAKIENVPESGELVRWLSEQGISFKTVGLGGTREFGLLEEYEKLSQAKCRPFNKITIDGDYLIKEPIDSQGEKLAVRETAWYEKAKLLNIPELPRIYDTSPLKMERVLGKNIYECDFDYETKKSILKSLVGALKALHDSDKKAADSFSIQEAYFNKTFDRLAKIQDLVPFARDKEIIVNGKKCRNVFYHRRELQDKLDELKVNCREFAFIHGDCTFSNLMVREDNSPVLIDPRGYFGFTELYGDVRYDWAKLYYSIVGNYDRFNLKQFRLEILENQDEGVKLQIDSNHWEDMEDDFFGFTGADKEEIKLLHAVIWLSLTTYAWQDYDSICGAFYNGLYYLEEVL